MTDTLSLGGRLPLLPPDQLDEQQSALYQRMLAHQVPWSEGHHFAARTDDHRLIGPFNPLLYAPGGANGFLDFEAAEGDSWSLGPRLREVVILSVGSIWQGAYELYAHSHLAQEAGFSDEAIVALRTGKFADEMSPDEATSQSFALQLSGSHRVDAGTYEAAQSAFGQRGLVEIALLVGRYSTICSLLNAFEVPSP
jgi:4-carboxymuconolactone decarboxylase